MPYQPYQSTWTNPYLPAYNQGQPVTPMVQPYQQPVNGVVKVNGRDSAMQYQLPPNSMSPALFDNNGKVFYIVSTSSAWSSGCVGCDRMSSVFVRSIRTRQPSARNDGGT